MAYGSRVGPGVQYLGRWAAAGSGVTATRFGGAEPFGALTFLFQLAGQTCIPVNRWAGHCCSGGGPWALARAAHQSHCLGGAENRDVWAGRRRKFDSARSPACARTCLPPPPPPVPPPPPHPAAAFGRGGPVGLSPFPTGLGSRSWPQ